MPGNFKKEDLRIHKTRRALQDSLYELIDRTNFTKLSVFDICERALISRSAFYVHYHDKYDLLEHLLRSRIREVTNFAIGAKLDASLANLTRLLIEKKRYLRNLLEDADQEQIRIIITALTIDFNPFEPHMVVDKENPAYSMVQTVVSGGLFNLLRVFAVGSLIEPAKLAEQLNYASDMFSHVFEWTQSFIVGGANGSNEG